MRCRVAKTYLVLPRTYRSTAALCTCYSYMAFWDEDGLESSLKMLSWLPAHQTWWKGSSLASPSFGLDPSLLHHSTPESKKSPVQLITRVKNPLVDAEMSCLKKSCWLPSLTVWASSTSTMCPTRRLSIRPITSQSWRPLKYSFQKNKSLSKCATAGFFALPKRDPQCRTEMAEFPMSQDIETLFGIDLRPCDFLLLPQRIAWLTGCRFESEILWEMPRTESLARDLHIFVSTGKVH